MLHTVNPHHRLAATKSIPLKKICSSYFGSGVSFIFEQDVPKYINTQKLYNGTSYDFIYNDYSEPNIESFILFNKQAQCHVYMIGCRVTRIVTIGKFNRFIDFRSKDMLTHIFAMFTMLDEMFPKEIREETHDRVVE